MPDKCDLGDNFEPTSPKTAPKMPQPPLPSTPKVQKTEEKKVFQCFFTLQPWYQNRSKMLPEPLQKLPSWVQNGNLAASMAHLRAYVGSSWRSCSPSCLSCSLSWLALTCTTIRSKMPSPSQQPQRQPPRCLSHPFRAPKVQKKHTHEKPTFF